MGGNGGASRNESGSRSAELQVTGHRSKVTGIVWTFKCLVLFLPFVLITLYFCYPYQLLTFTLTVDLALLVYLRRVSSACNHL